MKDSLCDRKEDMADYNKKW